CQAAEEPLWKRVLELVTSQRPAVLKVMKLCSVPCRSLLLPLLLLLIHPAKASSVFRKLRQLQDTVSNSTTHRQLVWYTEGPSTGYENNVDPGTGDGNNGDWSTEDWYTGDPSSGDGYGGDPSSGDGYGGDPSSGDGYSGDPSSGDGYSGGPSSGDGYSGDPSSGDGYSGEPSSGDGTNGDLGIVDWLTGDPSSGDGYTGGPSSGDGYSGDPSSGDGYSGDPSSGDGYSGGSSSGDGYSGGSSSGDGTNGDLGIVDWLTGDPSSGDGYSGDPSSEDGYSGDPSSGDGYSGGSNSGDGYTGGSNSGDGTNGDHGIVDWLTGDPSSGDGYSGNPSSGDGYSGDPSSGDGYSGGQSTGDVYNGGPNSGDGYSGGVTSATGQWTDSTPHCSYLQEPLEMPAGVITIGSSNGIYQDNQDCEWWLEAPTGTVLYITWLSFDIESHSHCAWDYVQLQELSATGQLLVTRKYCGGSLPPSITTTSRWLVVNFHSDVSVGRRGFSLRYTAAPPPSNDGTTTTSLPPSLISGPCIGSQEFTAVSGSVALWEYSYAYLSRRHCDFHLRTPEGTIPLLVFLNLRPDNCQGISVEVFDESSIDIDLTRNRLCQHQLPVAVTAHTNRVVVRLHLTRSSFFISPNITFHYYILNKNDSSPVRSLRTA
ncbi:hypothetical protein OTU49_004315, partial [Cherax quadricarinatus]